MRTLLTEAFSASHELMVTTFESIQKRKSVDFQAESVKGTIPTAVGFPGDSQGAKGLGSLRMVVQQRLFSGVSV